MFDSLANLPTERRYKGQQFPVPVVVAVLKRLNGKNEPEFLLIKRKQDPFQDMWALVGGKWDFGETLTVAVVREVWEETSLETGLTAVCGIINQRLASGVQKQEQGAHFLFFVCELHILNGKAKEQNEGAVAWFSWPEIQQLQAAEKMIPFDFVILENWTKTAVSVPVIEAEMSGKMTTNPGSTTELRRFEQV
ncbi:MAG: NUDIX hydrolase [Chloroflexi bacterium]|nr:MAG: NUDIX hydrolase [Chloroflexota bacterium]